MKFNLGSNNNFILKNSNIVIQQAPNVVNLAPQSKDQQNSRANSQGQRKANPNAGPTYKLDSNSQFGTTGFGATGFNTTKQRRAGNLTSDQTANYKVMQSYTGGSLGQTGQLNGKRVVKQGNSNYSGAIANRQRKRGGSENRGTFGQAPEGDSLNLVVGQ